MDYEFTFVMIKPRGVIRDNEIINFIVKNGLSVVVEWPLKNPPRELIAELYVEHNNKPWFEDSVYYLSSNSIILMVVRGENAVAKMRELIGATDPLEASPDTIRGIFGNKSPDIDERLLDNIIHGSDSVESAEREIQIFFPELVSLLYKRNYLTFTK